MIKCFNEILIHSSRISMIVVIESSLRDGANGSNFRFLILASREGGQDGAKWSLVAHDSISRKYSVGVPLLSYQNGSAWRGPQAASPKVSPEEEAHNKLLHAPQLRSTNGYFTNMGRALVAGLWSLFDSTAEHSVI